MTTYQEKLARLSEHRRERVIAAGVEQVRQEYTLRGLREFAAMKQAEVGQAMGVSQGAVSQIEGRGDLLVSTLQHYVGALGGSIEMVVTLPDRAPVRLALTDMVAALAD
jgi:hypothetical protein